MICSFEIFGNLSSFICFQDGRRCFDTKGKIKEGLTIHIETVVSDPLLPPQGWVDCLTAQRRPIVFPFYRDADGTGHTECLPIVKLGHHSWTETEGNTMMEGLGLDEKRWAGKEANTQAKTFLVVLF